MIELMPGLADAAVSRRRKSFVDAATRAFFAKGYGDTTMSSIATMVGGSKTTLWTYFPSKEALFAAVVDDIVEHHGLALSVELSEDEEIRLVLHRFGTTLLATLLSEPILNLHRLVVGEAKRFPHLAELFYERGARRGKARLAAYLVLAMEKSLLRSGDPVIAARQFAALCQAGRYQRAMMNLAAADGETSADRDVETAVDTFWRAWAPPP